MVNQRTIDEILGNLQPNQKETIQNLRILIKNAAPETVEIIKNGKITYKLGDKDFIWINHFSDHVDLEFAMGASLSSNLLCSRGIAQSSDNVRHIPIANNFNLLKPELSRLVSDATTLGFEHCPPR
ncbi:MAG: DUF1801 domain-containing protein [Ignavibacteria bacterium]